MERIISQNKGKTFTALGKVKHTFDKEIVRCKEEVTDLYSNIDDYVSEMSGIISASPAGSTMLVDRLDILANKTAIKMACDDIHKLLREQTGYTINTDNYKDNPERLAELKRDIMRNQQMREAIETSATKISGYCKDIDNIYKKKIVKFENADDVHETRIAKLHHKYSSRDELQKELVKDLGDMGKGALDSLKGIMDGILGLPGVVKSIPKFRPSKIPSFVESVCQSGTDTVAKKGYAYAIGAVLPEVVGAKGAGMAVKGLSKATKYTKHFNIKKAPKLKKTRYPKGPVKPKRIDAPPKVRDPERVDKPKNVDKPNTSNTPPRVRKPKQPDKPRQPDKPKDPDRPEKIDRGPEDRRRRDYDDREYKPGDTLPDGTRVIEVSSAKEANEQLAKQGYTRPPYDPDSPVYIVKTTGEQRFVRVYTDPSKPGGQWIMRYEDIKGLTPKQIKDKFALEKTPSMICDVEVPPGTKLRTGKVKGQKGWGDGGAQQYDFMGKHLPDEAWKNGREIGDYVK